MRIGVIGMFDGVHLGHQAMLRHIAAAGEAVIVTFRDHPLRLIAPNRAPMLLTAPDEKTTLLAGFGEPHLCDFTDDIRLLSAAEYMALLRNRLGIDRLVIGFDHRFGHDRVSDPATLRALAAPLGLEIEQFSEYVIEGIAGKVSSSAIRNALADAHIDTARLMLGRDYEISGTVTHGSQIGRTIGFPTANIIPSSPHKLIPAPGVYAATLLCDRETRISQINNSNQCNPKNPCNPCFFTHNAIVNIGSRPTVNGSELTIEAHIIDFDGDIYGAPVTLYLSRYIRPERRFPSLDALRSQILLDLQSLKTEN